MQAKRTSADLSDPAARAWEQTPVESIGLAATPLAGQPSRYIRTAWATQPYGLVRKLSAQAAHDGERLYLRLRWDGPAASEIDFPPLEGPDAFADAVAVMFPANGAAPLETMGSEQAPVSVWRWACGVPDTVESLTATGIGTVRPAGVSDGLVARSQPAGGSWQVVFSRPLGGDGAPALAAGAGVSIGFAVWAGANRERAGIKSATPSWSELELES